MIPTACISTEAALLSSVWIGLFKKQLVTTAGESDGEESNKLLM